MIKPEETILITGCGGMLGEGVYHRIKGRCRVFATDKDVNEPWLEYLDVSSKDQVDGYLQKSSPDYIIHLAAFTDMEYCETHPEETYATNEGGVKNFLPYVRQRSIPFLYISTAGIFDGEKDAYAEDDVPNPLSVYGKSKYAGELAARSVPHSIVIRAGWMMGGGPRKDKKFINKIVKQLQKGAKELSVVDDKLGTPCYTYDLARIIEYLLDKRAFGIYHGACSGHASRHDVAKFMLSRLELEHLVKVTKVGSHFFKQDYFAPRPRSEKLLNTKIPHLIRDWQVCLEEYLKKFDWSLDKSR